MKQCRVSISFVTTLLILGTVFASDSFGQSKPYDVFPEAKPPYYRVRYEPSDKSGELKYGVNYTIWIPPNVKHLRGVVVHQHGCGTGSCKSGLTGAFDLHWQALAKKHGCALLAPSYEQPDGADCQMWCDPRNGSAKSFQKCLVDLGTKSSHPELATVPWALWGHSGGGHWVGGMTLLYTERVIATWHRSGVPLLKPNPDRPSIKTHKLTEAALKVPMMCNLGTKEGVTVTTGRFSGVWPSNVEFFTAVRSKGGFIGVAIDPLSSHECGNQRYMAIPWLDSCMSARLPEINGQPLKPMPQTDVWLAKLKSTEASPSFHYEDEHREAVWLPNKNIAKRWNEYVKDTKVTDKTPPPAPYNVKVDGNKISWEADADLESGIAYFIIERDGKPIATVPNNSKNRFGRPLFQGLQYSDTPTQPLVKMEFTDSTAKISGKPLYSVTTVNTVGVKSQGAPPVFPR